MRCAKLQEDGSYTWYSPMYSLSTTNVVYSFNINVYCSMSCRGKINSVLFATIKRVNVYLGIATQVHSTDHKRV